MGRPKVRPEFYSIPTPCKCGCGGFVMNPDDHYRYRDFIDGHYDNAGDKHPRFGKKESEEHLAKRMDTLKQTLKSKPPTCLEQDLFTYLDGLGIYYSKQVRINTTIVDAYLPEYHLCVFADGTYWHNLPGMKDKDARQTKRLKELGYDVVRLPSINNGYNLDFTELRKFLLEATSQA